MTIRTSQRLRSVAGTFLGLLLGIGANAAPQLTLGHGSGDGPTPSPVSVTFSSDLPVVAVQFDVTFDPALLESGAPVLTSTSSTHSLLSSEPTPGVRRIVVYSTVNAILPNGPLLSLGFTALPRTPNGTLGLTLANAFAADSDARFIAPLSLVSGDFTVGPVVNPQLALTTLSSGGDVQLQLTGPEGTTFVLQVSQNLSQWIPLKTAAIPAGGTLRFSDTVSPATSVRFYRAIQQ